ncbi:DUF5630 domain-containing protein [uncultured Legionella sp.]|uniref:DUF5630 domain-containing protein n=1 Tax=uncultured Legionella sp. TaxID=210934 RepID=UPI00260873FE|nr:DUF5630 domain-containing protein [uncultured Legionella sp.]
MSCTSKAITTFLTLSDLSRLNFLEEKFLNDLKDDRFNESQFFSNKKTVSDIPFILKLARANQLFADVCKKDVYQHIWRELYSLLGFLMSSLEGQQVTFYMHEQVDSFDLLKGSYLFYLSQQVRAALSQEFSSSELNLLKEAMRFNSVHAVQRYNIFLHNKVINGKLEDTENSKTLLMDAVKNAKSLLEPYGSYAYMLLSEAFYQYAVWAKQEGDQTGYRKSLQAAISSCEKASKFLNVSKFSIYNASFGKGLCSSNSFSIDSPEEAKEMLEGLLAAHMNTSEIDNVAHAGRVPS